MQQPLHTQLRKTLTGAATALALIAVSRPTPASLVRAMDLVELTTNAGRVVVAEVLSVRSDWDKGRRWIYTTVELQVAEVWKGDMPRNGKLTVVQPGGSVGDIEMTVHGLRAFRAGDRAVLFLSAGDPAWTVGLGQGHRSLRFDAGKRRWMVDLGDRSAAWQPDPAGSAARIVGESADGVLPLEDMRRRVRALVRP
jgi:hypothetical protein